MRYCPLGGIQYSLACLTEKGCVAESVMLEGMCGNVRGEDASAWGENKLVRDDESMA